MRKVKLFIVVITISMLSVGCATLLSDTSTDIRINSEPQGASIYLDGIKKGSKTPARITLEHSYSDVWNEQQITLRLKGYEDRKFRVDAGIAGWYWGNILLGPFSGIGAIIDLVTGAWVSYDRTKYSVELRKETANLNSFKNVFYSRYMRKNLESLEKGSKGRYIIPSDKEGIVIHDKKSDVKIIFHKNN